MEDFELLVVRLIVWVKVDYNSGLFFEYLILGIVCVVDKYCDVGVVYIVVFVEELE